MAAPRWTRTAPAQACPGPLATSPEQQPVDAAAAAAAAAAAIPHPQSARYSLLHVHGRWSSRADSSNRHSQRLEDVCQCTAQIRDDALMPCNAFLTRIRQDSTGGPAENALSYKEAVEAANAPPLNQMLPPLLRWRPRLPCQVGSAFV